MRSVSLSILRSHQALSRKDSLLLLWQNEEAQRSANLLEKDIYQKHFIGNEMQINSILNFFVTSILLHKAHETFIQ